MSQIQRLSARWSIQEVFIKPEQVFLILATIFGVVMVFSMPLFMVPDEMAHFDRAYQVGGGHIFSQTIGKNTGGIAPRIPLSYSGYLHRSPLTWSHYFQRISAKDTTFVAFPAASVYSPLAYIPQAIGIDIGRAVYPSIGTLVLIGRLTNLTAYILLVLLAIRIAPRGKWVYVVIALFPVAIQQAASLSTDVMTIGLAFVATAFMHALLVQENRINSKQYLGLLFLAVGLGLTKQTNLIFLLPLVFINKRAFGSWSSKIYWTLGILGIAVLAAIAWYLALKFQHYNLSAGTPAGVNQVAQVKYILMHPLHYISTLFHSFVFAGFKATATSDFYLLSMYGVFSWISFMLPVALIFLGYTLLLLVLLQDDDEDILERRRTTQNAAIPMAITFLISILGIATALYIVWTPVGATQIAGIQGRYFIPLVPLLVAPFMVVSKYVMVKFAKIQYIGAAVGAVALINLTATVLLTLKYFY